MKPLEILLTAIAITLLAIYLTGFIAGLDVLGIVQPQEW